MSTAADIILIGAGLAGVTAASVLARRGVRVTLIDRWATYPACFKAEKIEPDQIALFRKFGLMETLRPWTGHIRGVVGAQNGRELGTRPIEQFGIFYHDMVNAIRESLPSTVDFKVGRVQEIKTGVDEQRVTLVGGEECTARLVALACGTGGDLHSRLGMKKQMVQKDQSLAFGFTIAPAAAKSFPFDALTYYPNGCGGRVGFLTLFRIGTAMRANLFVFWSASDPATKELARDPRRELSRVFPKLTNVIGNFEVVSKVETSRIDLYRMQRPLEPGIILLADSFQSVCPTTGSGLSKVLTDVDVLCDDCLPKWLSTPGMGVEKVGEFYQNRRKNDVDDHSLADASFNREIAINDALRWRAQRVRRRWTRQIAGLAASF